jgi:dimethylargininase
MFKKAIVKIPCKNLIYGLTSANLGKRKYLKALSQHRTYVEALKNCGLEITTLEADENFPDSTFVEDTALLTPKCAIITNPGAPSRKGEIIQMSGTIKNYYKNIEKIKSPGTLEAGDVMMIGNHYYIGLSKRTNDQGADQLIDILNKYGFSGSKIILEKGLHLKSAVSYIENNNLLVTSDFINKSDFQGYNLILVDDDESYAANSLWINDNVLVPKGFPKTKQNIEELGYSTIAIDVSEFRKLDGGLSCLSLRF